MILFDTNVISALMKPPVAATALARGATLATRNTSDFAACGITVENPWAP